MSASTTLLGCSTSSSKMMQQYATQLEGSTNHHLEMDRCRRQRWSVSSITGLPVPMKAVILKGFRF